MAEQLSIGKPIHLKGLNGLRAIAALSVVWGHVGLLKNYGLVYTIPMGLGQYGVTIFFALSGFLITYLLFIEKQITGISIKRFYIRRMLRIWPLYFTYLLVAITTLYIYAPGKLPGPIPYYLFFAANVPMYLGPFLPLIGHYWSLGVEEQFYLFWPWLIKKTKNVLKGLIVFTIGFLLLKLIFRYIYFRWDNITPLFIISTTRFDCMAFGGIAAFLCIKKHTLFLRFVTHRVTEIICWTCVAIMVVDKFYITAMVDQDAAAIVAVGLIVNQAFNAKPLISLENRFFDLLGKLSYGMYIIHPLVRFFYGEWIAPMKMNPVLKAFITYGGNILLTILAAWLSYEFLEKRFLFMKDKFSQVKSSDTVENKE